MINNKSIKDMTETERKTFGIIVGPNGVVVDGEVIKDSEKI